MLRGDPTGSVDHANSLDNNDSVVVTIPVNTHLVAMTAIANAIGSGGSSCNNIIVVANDDSGGTEYLAGSGITACGTITVAAVYANS